MNKWLDWCIAGVIVALVWMAQFQLVFTGVFDALSLSAGIALIVFVRILHQHVPRFITAKYRKKR